MVEILEYIVILFGIFGAISLVDTAFIHNKIKCEECNRKLQIEYNESDSTYFAVCDSCKIYYDVIY